MIELTKEKKEYIEGLKKAKQTKYYPFDVISRKISVLLETAKVAEKHPDEFPEEWQEKLKEIKVGHRKNIYK